MSQSLLSQTNQEVDKLISLPLNRFTVFSHPPEQVKDCNIINDSSRNCINLVEMALMDKFLSKKLLEDQIMLLEDEEMASKISMV
jgi:hypothetical protein